jgi:hypothetical protein
MTGPAPTADVPVDAARQQEAHAAPSTRAFLLLAAQVAGLMVAAYFLRRPMFAVVLVWGLGFFVHYWLPFAFKKACWVALGAIGLFVALPPDVALLMAGLGLLPYPIVRARLPLVPTVAALLLVGAVAVVIGRGATPFVALSPELGDLLIVFFGGTFAIRLILYIHYCRHHDAPPALIDYLAYFFALPLLGSPFPFLDHAAMMDNYYRRDGQAIAQEGLKRIYIGSVQVLACTYAYKLPIAHFPPEVQSLPDLLAILFLGYVTCVMFSAFGHWVVGMCLLFGYDLPPLHRWYVFARGPLDFWRRNNIYLKDMMQKLVYLPVYFRVSRRHKEGVAQLYAFAAVFAAVAASEIWVRAWMTAGRAPVSELSATSFRAVLGIACLLDAWFQLRRRRRRKPSKARVAVSIALTLVFMSLALQLEWLKSASTFVEMIVWWN